MHRQPSTQHEDGDRQMSDTFHQKRMTIPILAKLGWSTDVLRNLPNFSTLEDEVRMRNEESPYLFSRFFSSMHAYEDQLLTRKSNQRMLLDMQTRLGIKVCFKTGQVTPLEHEEPWTTPDASKASSLICAYKVVDTCARLLGIYPRDSPPMPRRVEHNGNYLTDVLNRVASIKKVLLDFKEQLGLAKAAQQQGSSSIALNANNHQRLFHFAAQVHMTRQKTGVLENVSMFSALLSFLKDTHFLPGQVPDIPDDYIKKIDVPGANLDPIDAKYFKTFGNTAAGANAMRSALHVGLGLTPILLFHSTPLSRKKGYDRNQLINTWAALGTDKPPLVVEIEDTILRILFDVSVGLVTPLDALEILADNLPWDAINDMSDEDDTWFVLRPPSEPSPRPFAHNQHTATISDIHVSSHPPSLPASTAFSLHDPSAESIRQAVFAGAQSFNLHFSQPSALPGFSARSATHYLEYPQAPAALDTDPSPSFHDLEQEGNSFDGQISPVHLGDGEAFWDSLQAQASEEDVDMDEIPAGRGMADRIIRDDEDEFEQNNEGRDKHQSGGDVDSIHDEDGDGETDEDFLMDLGGDHNEDGEGTGKDREGNVSDTEVPPGEDEERACGDGPNSGEEESSSSQGNSTKRTRKSERLLSLQQRKEGEVSEDESETESNEGEDREDDISAESGENESESAGSRGGSPKPSTNKPEQDTNPKPKPKPGQDTNPKPKPKPGQDTNPKPKPKPNPGQDTPKPKANKGKSKEQTIPTPGRSIESAIDVDALPNRIREGPFAPKPELDLKTDLKPKRISDNRKITVYGPRGEEHFLEPQFHFADMHKDLHGFIEAVESHYVDGRPRHCQKNAGSMIAVMTEEEYLKMTPKEVQDILARQHIVMDQASTREVKFDAAGLKTVRPLHTLCSIQDTSISSDEKMDVRIITGTLQQILDSVNDPQGKFLNGLDFPGSDLATPITSHATELTAWHYTRGAKGYFATAEYPRAHMRWYLVSTGNTITWVHIDSDGVCSEIVVLCGMKVWMLGAPKKEYSLADVMTFLREDFYVESPGDELVWEAVVLTPGTRLLMRPGAPHTVITPKPTICAGGHFFSGKTMEDTAISLMHSFVCNELITNTVHHPTRMLLRRMAQFFHEGLVVGTVEKDSPEFQHLPNLDTFSGVLNLLSLCNLVILSNALDHRTYSAPGQKHYEEATQEQKDAMANYDVNDIDYAERLEMIFARGICIHLLQWFEAHYEIVYIENPSDRVGSCAGYYLGKQAAALLFYKELACPATGKSVVGAPHCTPGMLKSQLENILPLWEGATRSYESPHIDRARLDYGPKANLYKPIKRDVAGYWPDPNENTLRSLGTTSFDKKYILMKTGGRRPQHASSGMPSGSASAEHYSSTEEQPASKRRRK